MSDFKKSKKNMTLKEKEALQVLKAQEKAAKEAAKAEKERLFQVSLVETFKQK